MAVLSISVGDDEDDSMPVAMLLTRAALAAATEAGAPSAVLDHLLEALREFEAAGFDAQG